MTPEYLPNSPREKGETAAFANEKGKPYARPLLRSFQWTQVEKRFGKPMREILLTAHMEHGSFYAMSNALGVTHTTLQRWWSECRLPSFGVSKYGTVVIVICGETSDTPTETEDNEGAKS